MGKKKKKSTKKKNDNSSFIRTVTILFIILMCVLIYVKYTNDTNEEKLSEEQRSSIFSSVTTSLNADITKFSVYGTHFNLEGTLDVPDISKISVSTAELVMMNVKGETLSISTDYTYSDNTLTFSSYENINTGIDLESLSITDYYIFLKVTYSNSNVNYYSLVNDSEYDDITYYTITKNNKNNEINIKFSSYQDIPCLNINVTKVSELPDDVYDVAIDPGHGGSNPGATVGDYTEADLVLENGLVLKEKLEALGLKVFMSRDENSDPDENTAYTMYDDDGRINILNESHAKIIISLHLNSNEEDLDTGGIEIYAPNNCDLTFASLLAQNIVTYGSTTYSELTTYKEADGVYVRNFTNSDILEFKTKALKGGYEQYNITTSTPYLFIIRETGGISTNAFVDGRNPSYGTNKYYNSNIGSETYLIELAYMIVDDDFSNFLENSESYMDGIAASIQSFYLSD